MKVLVIDEWLPWPLESGKKIRSFNLISQLAGRYEILYLAYVDIPKEIDKVKAMEKRGIRIIPVPDVRAKKWTIPFYLSVAWNLASKKPFSSAYHIKEVFKKKLIEVIDCEKPNLVHCEWTNLSPFLEYMKGVPKIISAHNIESEIWKRLAQTAKNPIVRLVGRNQAKKIERLEREWYPKVDHCIAVSQEDARVIRAYGGQVTVIDNGVDIQYYNVIGPEAREKRLVYVSSLDTFSNQDAVSFFVEEIFPLLKPTYPDAEFWVVGKDPPKRIRDYGRRDPRIKVTGSVPDVRDYITRSSICVVPLRIGGGSRLKILEAMAMKKPVVSTSVGAEGLRVENGKNIAVADKAEDFALRVKELLSNGTQRRELGQAGYELVRSQYDWRALAEKQNCLWRTFG